jgi:hypothetical protein
MAERDRAPVHVEPLLVDAELAGARQHLGGERLVELDQLDITQLEPGGRECPAGGRDRPDSHVGRVDPGHPDRDDPGEGLAVELGGGLLARHQ